jgi:response regulator RpfG family c-di-GMP phosphodiesterase
MMMSKIVILCVDDQREVLDALERDLRPFAGVFRIEVAESAQEAANIVEDLLRQGDRLGLVLADHLMPGTTGVDLLVALAEQDSTRSSRKVLVTAHAGLEDTVKAVNEADLDHYIAKPWTQQELHNVVRKQLTDFVLQQETNLLPYLQILDKTRLLEAVRQRGSDV